MKFFLALFCSCCFFDNHAQSIKAVLYTAFEQLEADSQFKHAIIGMYVVESKSGSVVYGKNAEIGLVPASCQKIITSAAAFDLLGANYHFTTELAYKGSIADSTLTGNVYIIGKGDPSLGSWRWSSTKEQVVQTAIMNALSKAGIRSLKGKLFGYDASWETNTTPGGWVWEDIGNYYGAGASALNWRENQYELILKAGAAKGDTVSIVACKPALPGVMLHNALLTGEKGSGDNAWIYLPPLANEGYVRGTIPADASSFSIAGAMPDAAGVLANTIADQLKQNGGSSISYAGSFNRAAALQEKPENATVIHRIQSPSFDSLNYWFLKKSVNLYGEAFLKAIGSKLGQSGSTTEGINQVKKWAARQGIEPAAINIKDGSGLSPSNRITCQSLVTVLRYAARQLWFNSFYNALPQLNGITMKDGYMGGVRSYAGYIRAANGNEYTFAFIVNNFDGNASAVREKIWKILNLLKQ